MKEDNQVKELPDNFEIPGTHHINDWVKSVKSTDDGKQDNLELQLCAAKHKHQYTQKLLRGALNILNETIPSKKGFINEDTSKNGVPRMSEFINQQRSVGKHESG